MQIELNDITYYYNQGWADEVPSLDRVNARIQSGEILAILGREGSGKSTLLQHFNGLLTPSRGQVIADGKALTPKLAATLRVQVAMVFQFPEHQLFAATVLDDISFAARRRGWTQPETQERVREAARIVGLNLELLGLRRPLELSGGERRRVAIAGALVTRPELILMDEPTAGLDPIARQDLIVMLKRWRDERGTGIVLVSHSLEEALAIADRLMVLDGGKVVFDGTRIELLRRGDDVKSWGLRLPLAVEFARMLRARGVPILQDAWEMDQVVAVAKVAIDQAANRTAEAV